MVREFRVGLVGAGFILDSHASALKAVKGVKLAAVCDRVPSRAQVAAAKYGIEDVFDSIDDIVASDCDCVHIILPPPLHVDVARRLLGAGKHVFIEKPMGLDSASCRALAAYAVERNLKVGVNHNFLFLPAYQAIRDAVHNGEVGTIDQISIDWLYPLPLINSGPFNNWILAAPQNLVFELGPHLAAFACDLAGRVTPLCGHAGAAIDLPGNQRVYRHWQLIGNAGADHRTAVNLNISVAPGQRNRRLMLRATGLVAHLDFDRGVASIEHSRSVNPIFDNMLTVHDSRRAIAKDARRNFRRHALATLLKRPNSNPFSESIYESISTFYERLRVDEIDPRHSAEFGVHVIELCEGLVDKAGVPPQPDAPVPSSPVKSIPTRAATVLVVGGTGFIGRGLVKRLIDQGRSVRVVTRNAASAHLDLSGIDVDIVEGSHGDPTTLSRALPGIEVVYHLAKADGRRWQDYVEQDVDPCRVLADASLRHGVKRFIYRGTIDSYDSAAPSTVITGDTPLDSRIATRNHYARSKAMCEELLVKIHREKGFPVVILRPGIVIGAGSPPFHWGVGLFNSESNIDYWGDGTNPIPFVLVDDVVDGLVRALDAPGIEGRTFLLTDAPLMSARDYVAAVEARAGLKLAARSMPIWRHFAIDAVKEAAKYAIRHANRRSTNLHDWACRSHKARYDSRATQEALGWKPAGTKERLIAGVNASVDRYMR